MTTRSELFLGVDGLLSPHSQLKPASDAKSGVTLIKLPDSEFSLRIWRGSCAHQLHCLDLVDTDTTHPVNFPPGFEIWMLSCDRDPTMRSQRLPSLENIHGCKSDAIPTGEEKFVLRDRMPYGLHRVGKELVVFTAPM